MADEQPETEQDTISGLWRVLVRMVPASRREDAVALGNSLDYFIGRRARREGYDAGVESARADKGESFERGYAAGVTATRLAVRAEDLGVFALDEMPADETKH